MNQGIQTKRVSGQQKQIREFSQIFTPGFSGMCRAKLDMICDRIKNSTAEYLIYTDGDIVVLNNFMDDLGDVLP